MIKFAQNNGSQRRSFRLSPLETLILGLVVVGALYLLTLWVTSFFPSSPQAQPLVSSDQSNRALVAAEKALARVNALNKELAALNEKMDQVNLAGGGKTKTARADAKLTARVKALEKKLAGPSRKLAALENKINKIGEELAQTKKNSDPAVALAALEPKLRWLEKNLQRIDSSPPVLDPRVVARLDGLEKKLSVPSPELTAAEKKIRHIEEELARTKKDSDPAAALAALQPRVKKLEKELQTVESKASATGPELSVRLDNLEKGLEDQLKPLEDKVKRLEQSQAWSKKGPNPGVMVALLEPRLKRMEHQLKVLGSSSAATQSKLTERVGALEKSPSSPSPEIVSLKGKIEKIQKELDGRKDERGVAALNLRLHRLEKEILRTRQSLRRVHAPLPDPELATRVEKLEKRLGSSSMAPGRMEERLRNLSAQVQALARSRKEADQGPPKTVKKQAAPTKTASARPLPAPEKTKIIKPKPMATAPSKAPPPKLIRYKVRRGDTLYALARRYRVRMNDIRNWNPKIKRRRYLWIGETLVIYSRKKR